MTLTDRPRATLALHTAWDYQPRWSLTVYCYTERIDVALPNVPVSHLVPQQVSRRAFRYHLILAPNYTTPNCHRREVHEALWLIRHDSILTNYLDCPGSERPIAHILCRTM